MNDKLIANRGAGYRSVRDLWLRSGLQKFDIERLADADAFRSIGLGRREALWEVRALEAKSVAEKLPLFDVPDHADLQIEPSVALPSMLPGEQVIEDYRYLSLSLKAHPVSFLRTELAQMGITRSVDLLTVANGSMVTIAGLVLVRQRPGSSKGVVFMTLEDETGVSNAIVWPKIFDKYRPVVMGARLVKIRGRLQSQSGVIHVVVDRIDDMTHALGILQHRLQRFDANGRSEAPLRKADDRKQLALPLIRSARDDGANRVSNRKAVAETVAVMPKGRNFH
jgi:DNA polymerase III alpha subunit